MISTMHFPILNLRQTFLLMFIGLGALNVAFAQCPTSAGVILKTHTNISCFGASDGTITVELGDGAAPLNFELYDNNLGTFVTLSVTEAEDPDGNGNFRKVTYSDVYASSFQVLVYKAGCGAPLSVAEGFGTVVTEPPALSVSPLITTDCDPAVGAGNGAIDLTPSGGTAPYTFAWSDGATTEDRAGLDAGSYSVDVTDANGCAVNVNISVPGLTQADAGAATGLACGTNSFALSANAPGANETGTWTGPAGVTFSPSASDPNATAGNLSAGSNVLTWTISDNSSVCTSTADNIDVTYSPAITLTPAVTDVLCQGASTGAVDLTVAGGIAPFTYVWSNGGSSEDLSNIPAATYSVTVTDAAGCSASLNNIVVAEPASTAIATATGTNVTCFGAANGSIAVTVTGGTSPYDFSIDGGATYPILDAASNTFSGLAPGTYDVKVRDANGCETPATPVSITQPASALGATTSQVDVTCFGGNTGSISIAGTGGTAPYDFSIDGGATYSVTDVANHTFSGLLANTYNLRVRDANGCETGVIPVTVAEPSAVGATTVITDVSCFGGSTGSISITGTGGTAPYDFSIDGGATYPTTGAANETFSSLSALTYNLRVRDANGCESAVIPATVSEPASAVGATTSQVDVTCAGASTGSITVTGTGGSGLYDFSIDGGSTYPVVSKPDHTFSGLAANTYNLRVRDANGCETAVIAVTIAEPAAVSGTTVVTDVGCFGASTGSIAITGTGGTGPYDFSKDGGATYPVTGAANNTFSGLPAGTYDLKVRDAMGCESAPISITIAQPASTLDAIVTPVDVTCFGGNTGSIEIAGTGGTAPYDFSIDGGATYSVNAVASHTFSGLVAATYNLKVRDANGCETAVIPVTINEPAAVGATTTQLDVSCFGVSTGSITVTGTGGTGLYDFSIDGGATYAATGVPDHTFSGLPAAAYSLKVRDANGCESAVIPVTITEPSAVTGTTTQVDETCFGGTTGSITITGGGGTGPYNFSIDGGATYTAPAAPDHTFTALAAATYSLKVRDANGCESAAISVTITEPVEVTASLAGSGPVTVCEGSALPDIIITFTGTAPFDFTYTDGTTPVTITGHPTATYTIPTAAPGAYSVTALTDGTGCAAGNLGGTVTVTEETAPTAEAGNAQDICGGTLATLTGAGVGGSASTGAWQIITQPTGGDGVLSDENQTATPAAVTFTATVGGAYTLRLTTDDPTGVCDPAYEDVIINVFASPAANAGGDQTICDNGFATLSGSFTGSTGVKWTTAGDGSFDDDAAINAIYTPGGGDISSGSVTLTLSTLGPCAPVSDDVVITIDPAPTVDAGSPQTICSNTSVVLNGSFGSSATGLLWSSSGNGSFNDNTDVNATYTPGSDDMSTGSVTLTATATGSCAGVFDAVTITINPAATFDAGPDQTICSGNTVTLDGTLGGSASTVTWTTSGDGIFSDPADADPVYTFGTNDKTNGTVTLTATTNNPPGACTAGSDDVTIKYGIPGGDQTTAGNETWIGYVYDDAGDPAAIPAKINFDNSKYRGYIDETDIANMSAASKYETATDTFDLNLGLTSGVNGPNMCGTYLNFFSVRYKMDKTFAAGVYRFKVGADDGVKLLIDGTDVLPATAFDLHSYTTYTSEPICLTAGVHTLEIQYFDNSAQSRLNFQYEEVPALAVTSPVVLCMNSTAPVLTVSSTDTDIAEFHWYKNGTLVFSGTSYTPAAADLDMGTPGTTTFQVAAAYGCGETPPVDVTVQVLSASDPGCSGGDCASVVIVPKPEPATCTNSDGKLTFSIKPFTPVVNTTGIVISIDGVSSTNLSISRTIYNDTVFTALPVGTYDYSIEYGDPSCVKTGQVTIDQSGTVAAPIASNVTGPVCPGSATASLTLDVPGETGNILEWSLDGGLTDPFKPFTAGGQITGIPAGPAPTFEQVISVRRNISDPCYAAVTVVIAETVQPISATFDITPATCNGNDGGINNIEPSGGNGGPYTFSINGGQSFQSEPDFNGLAGGSYSLRVKDGAGCENDFAAIVTFPGFINFSASKNDANCTNNGYSGSISVRIDDPGVFEVALTTDQFNDPADSAYLAYTNPSIVFNGLPRGQYYIFVRSQNGGCPTRSAPIDVFGVYPINFDIEPDCINNELSIALVNVTGDAGGPPMEIRVFKKLSPDPPEIIPHAFPSDGEIYLSHDEHTFLQTPGEYRIVIVQHQEEVFCSLFSPMLELDVPAPLSASTGSVSKSYPDVPTGKLDVVNFSGGISPYQVRIELDSAASFSLPEYSTDFEEASINANQQFQMAYKNIPAGRYQVMVSDSLGCAVSLVARVPLDEDLFIPNVFTPNGDGSNDVFFIRNLPTEPAVSQLVISNRWGKEVFTSENYQNNWDGTGAADGLYFYRLKVQDGKPLTGWVEIMRGPKP